VCDGALGVAARLGWKLAGEAGDVDFGDDGGLGGGHGGDEEEEEFEDQHGGVRVEVVR
jgi:hypothetical protein